MSIVLSLAYHNWMQIQRCGSNNFSVDGGVKYIRDAYINVSLSCPQMVTRPARAPKLGCRRRMCCTTSSPPIDHPRISLFSIVVLPRHQMSSMTAALEHTCAMVALEPRRVAAAAALLLFRLSHTRLIAAEGRPPQLNPHPYAEYTAASGGS